MTFTTLFLFSIVALVTIATPGPTVLLALSNGTRYGVRRSLPGMLGAVASDIVLVTAVALGLGALLAASEFWFSALKWVGAAYLAWLGVQLLRSKGGFEVPVGDPISPEHGARKVFMKSFLVAVTNPKGYLFCSALMPQFIDPNTAQLPQYLAIGAVFCAVDFSVMLAYAFVGAKAVAMLKASAVRLIDRVCGATLLALAASLALYRRAN